jgi:hypothetical protein
MKVLVRPVFLVATLVTLIAAPTHAKLTPAQKCAVAKEKATAAKTVAEIKCHRKTKLAAPADPACLQKAEDKFAKAFAKADAAGTCQVTGDGDSIGAKVDVLVNALVDALRPAARATTTTPAQKCADTKLQAAGNDTSAQFKCHEQSLSTISQALLALCLADAKSKLDTAFEKAEAPGTCTTTGDAGTIKDTVDTFVTDTTRTLVPPATPATPTGLPGAPTPTPGGSGSTRCCQMMWLGVPSCLDAEESRAVLECGIFSGTVPPAGQVCDGGGSGSCGSVKTQGACCACVGPPQIGAFCFESPTQQAQTACQSGNGCSLQLGACGPNSGTCGGP